jgi:hypothetical protein
MENKVKEWKGAKKKGNKNTTRNLNIKGRRLRRRYGKNNGKKKCREKRVKQ